MSGCDLEGNGSLLTDDGRDSDEERGSVRPRMTVHDDFHIVGVGGRRGLGFEEDARIGCGEEPSVNGFPKAMQS